jgi:predicted negative regulator of RcsB-dependent stress response
VKFSALEAAVQSSPSMLPLALEAARLAEEKNDLVSAQAILRPVVLGLTASSAFYPFVAHNYAAYAEQNGQVDEALRIYADYIKAGHKILLVKAYLEVGRLQLMKGNKTEAKTHFDYIVANHPNDELTKLAKLYLQLLK